MNPFVNPNNRGISLPDGCKDLVDVLNLSEFIRVGSIRPLIRVVLYQAQQDQATELVLGTAPPIGETSVRCKVKGAWHAMPPLPSHLRPAIVSELARMASLPQGGFPCEGRLNAAFAGTKLRWVVKMHSADGECRLTRIRE